MSAYTDDELKAIRSEYAKDATDEQFLNFIREANQRNMIPGRHLYFQTRKVSEWDAEAGGYVKVKRATHLTSIDAFRLIAQRTKEYEGQAAPVYIYFDEATETFRETTVPLPDKPPYAVQVSVFRKAFQQPLTATARFSAYAVYYRKNNEQILSDMWKRRGPEQLAKCAEALALRQAFPEELAGLYISEEMKDEEPQEVKEVETSSVPRTASTPPPETVAKPAMNHKPAEGKDEPRPSKKSVSSRHFTREEALESGIPVHPDATGVTVHGVITGEKKRRGRPPKAEQPKPDQPEVDQAKKNLEETGNVAGLQITDKDLPDFDGKEAQAVVSPPLADPPSKPEPAPDPLPTKEERVAYVNRMREVREVLSKRNIDSDTLRAFVVRLTGNADPTKLTKGQWERVVSTLNNAGASSEDALIAVVTGPAVPAKKAEA